MTKRKTLASTEVQNKKRKNSDALNKFKEGLAGVDPFSALKNFCELAENKDDNEDIVKELLDEDGNCNRIMELLDTQERRNAEELSIIFMALAHILLRLVADLEGYSYVGRDVGKKILQTHRSSVVYLLSPMHKSSQIKCVLRLLSAIVSQGEGCAMEMLNRIDLTSKELDKLATRTDIKDPLSVRVCLVHFILSFLFFGGTTAIRQLLQQKDAVSRLFSAMKSDPVDLIVLVLKTIKTEILENVGISKTLKVRAFGFNSIKPLLYLFTQWTGPMRFKEKKLQKNDQPQDFELDLEDKQEMMNVVSDFLLTLCTSHKYGIAFMDRELGLTRNNNHVLFSLFRELKKPWENERTRELVLAYLESCPDQVKFYLPMLESMLEARTSKTWLSAHAFCIEAIRRQDASRPFKTGSHNTVKEFLTMICSTVLPNSVTGKHLLQTLSHEDFAIRHSGIELLKTMLVHIERLKAYCNIAGTHNYSTAEKIKYFYATQDVMNKVLPSAEVVYKCWSSAVKDSSIKSDTLVNHHIVLMEVLCYYAEFLPHQTTDLPAEVGSILATVQDLESAGKHDNIDHLYLPTIKLVTKLHNPNILLLEKDMERNILYLTLRLVATSSNEKLVTAGKELFNQLMVSCGVVSSRNTLQPWLLHIDDDMERIRLVVDLFQTIFQQELETKKLEEESSLCLEDIEQMLKDLKPKESEKKEPESVGVSDISIVSVALKMNRCPEYLSLVLLDYIHMTEDLDAMYKLLKRHQEKVEAHLISYATFLYTGGHYEVHPKKPKTDSGCFSEWLQYIFVSGKTKYEEHINEKLTETWIRGDLFPIVKQICCYLNCLVTSERDDKEEMMRFYTNVLQELVRQRLDEDDQTEFIRSVLDSKALQDTSCPQLLCTGMYIMSQMIEFCKRTDQKECLPSSAIGNYIRNFVAVLKCDLEARRFMMFKKYKKFVGVFEAVTEIGDLEDSLRVLMSAPAESFTHGSGFLLELMITLIQTLNKLEDRNSNRGEQSVWSTVKLKQEDVDLLENLRGPKRKSKQPELGSDLNCTALGQDLLIWYCNSRREGVVLSQTFEDNLAIFFGRYQDVLKAGDRDAVINSCLGYEPAHIELLNLTLDWKPWLQEIRTWLEENIDQVNMKPKLKLMLMYALKNGADLQSVLPPFASEGEQLLSGCLDLEKWEKDAIAYIYWKYASGNLKKLRKHSNRLVSVFEYNSFEIPCESRFQLMWHLNAELQREHNEGYENWTSILLNVLNRLISEDLEHALLPKVVNKTMHQMNVIEKLQDDQKAALVQKILTVRSGSTWNDLIRQLLKLVLSSDAKQELMLDLARILCSLCSFVLKKKGGSGLQAAGILQILVSHPGLSNILIEQDDEPSPIKEQVVRLWLMLVELCPEECQQRHVPLLLAAYSASLSSTDQLILQLLNSYSTAEHVDMRKYSPLAWGVEALRHYVVKTGAVSMYTTPAHIVESINADTIQNTLLHFPISYGMQVDVKVKPTRSDCYDYRFLLSLCLDLFQEYGPAPKCSKFVESGCLALTVMALSSVAPEVRLTGYTILARFYKRLEIIRTNERVLWLAILDTIRFGCETPGSRLPPLLALFLARSTFILRKHAHPMYTAVASMLIHKANFSFRSLPEWYQLWNSQTLIWKTKKTWLLSLLKDGCKTHMDYKLVEQKGGVRLLLSSYPSSLCDQDIRGQIVQVLDTWAGIPYAANDLISRHSIILWLNSQLNIHNCIHFIKLTTKLATSLRCTTGLVQQEVFLFLTMVMRLMDEDLLKDNTEHVAALLRATKQRNS